MPDLGSQVVEDHPTSLNQAGNLDCFDTFYLIQSDLTGAKLSIAYPSNFCYLAVSWSQFGLRAAIQYNCIFEQD